MATSAPSRRRGNLAPLPDLTRFEGLFDPVSLQRKIRQAQIARNWDAYHGVFPDSIKQKRNQPNFNLKVNLIKPPVRKTNAFLFGQEVGIDVRPDRRRLLDRQLAEVAPGQAENPAQVYLDEFWQENSKMLTLQEGARYGAVTGDCFVKLVVDPMEEYPRLVVLDPATVEVETKPDDCKRAVAFTISYQAMDAGTLYDYEQRMTRDMGGQSWTIQDFRRPARKKEAPWQAASDPQVWGYAFPPLFHCQDTIQPGSYHGCPAFGEDAIHLNHAYNFILSNLYKSVYYFGHPRTKGFGFKKSDLPADPDDVTVLPSKDSTLDILNANVDVAGGLALADRLEAALYKLLSVNGMTLGDLADVPKGQIAALAIQLLFQVLIDLTNERRLTYGQMIADICAAVLQIAGYGARRRVMLRWPPMLPVDYQAAAAAAEVAQEAGLSERSALEMILGADADVERQRREEEERRGVPARRRGRKSTGLEVAPLERGGLLARTARNRGISEEETD